MKGDQEVEMRGAVTIRRSTVADRAEVARLAALDSSKPIMGEVVLGFVDGGLAAAVGVADGRAVADPFEPTADLVELLRMRAEQERDKARTGSGVSLLARLVPAWRGEVGGS